MKVLVCGGRDYEDKETVFQILDALQETRGISFVITGGASGADFLAHQWASSRRKDVRAYPANWDKHGKSAGIIRNQEMLKYGQPDLIVAFPGGNGTAHMVKIAKKAGVEVVEIVGESYDE